jgi:hypothetical protein
MVQGQESRRVSSVRSGCGGRRAILAAMVSYFTTIATVQQQTPEVKTTEAAHFQEVLRRFDMLQSRRPRTARRGE